ncbi:Interleukin-17 receptor E [Anabarilius grahami]|uniref:Interleukin-17 receptor E n=1 Tax=Anabarilius grahami TaxID=495550 RepID=A0A3N0XP07_ANAGA|nr:Interleukin-17 receptor E [Anabarilius grahami]
MVARDLVTPLLEITICHLNSLFLMCCSEDRHLPQLILHTALLQQDPCVRLRLCVRPLMGNETLTIDFSDSETGDTLHLLVWKRSSVHWCINSCSDDLLFQPHKARIQTREMNMTSHQAFWILRYDCFPARSGSTVTVSVHRDIDLLISGSHIVQLKDDEDPVPEARVSVDERDKRFTVCMNTDQMVKISLCHKHSFPECVERRYFGKINTTVNQTVDLSFPYLIPCVCVQLWFTGIDVRRNTQCPLKNRILPQGRSEWSVTVVPGSLHLHVHLTSNVAASFAAQLCDRHKDKCASRGHVISRQLVWRLDLHGRRIICPDFTHRRWGLITGAALTLLAVVTLLVCFTRWLVKSSTLVWWSAERRPVLLVCSSNDTAHITAVCSLASGLQGELYMDVRLAQWMQCHPQFSLAQLGPVPWLYGQCQAVQKAGGLVLIAWSPDALRAYLRWRKSERKAELCKTGLYSAVEEEEEEQLCCDEECMEKPMESSSITAPVFNAALSCLWTGIRGDCHGRGFGLVCFPSLNNNITCIPKRLRCVRKYCLPKDLPSLINDLTGSQDGTGKTKGRCWPRLLSKALSLCVSRQLAPRLEAKLPVPTDSPKFIPSFSQKLLMSRTKRKTWRQKKRRSKAVSSCLSRKGCSKKNTVPELHTTLDL